MNRPRNEILNNRPPNRLFCFGESRDTGVCFENGRELLLSRFQDVVERCT